MHMKTVYVGMVGDMLHAGHLNVLNKARELGEVTVGILTDEAASTYKRLPYLSYNDRRTMVENIKGISAVVPQNSLSYRENLLRYRPNFLVHGDDWQTGPQQHVRLEATELLAQWGGQLVEIAYTSGISSTLLHAALHEEGVLALQRQQRFRRLLEAKKFVRLIEVHNAVSARVADQARASMREFDGFWASSLTDSTARGRPDIEVVDLRARLSSIEEILDMTSKPLIYDGDTGGNLDQAYYLARSLAKLGVSGLCLEDKIGRKRNSLFGQTVVQTQATIPGFCEKLRAARRGAGASGMMVIARIESLVRNHDSDDALQRALAYCEAGADAILIHSVADTPREVLDFSHSFRKLMPRVPLIAVPTAFDEVTGAELEANGFNMVIYANHLMRAAYSAMKTASADILESDCGASTRSYSASAKDLLAMFPEPDL